jgi:hypothetical protein
LGCSSRGISTVEKQAGVFKKRVAARTIQSIEKVYFT